MTARSKIVDRIRQLREMTAGRGCTEAEALAAAAKAAELMEKHGLAEDDLVFEDAISPPPGRSHAAMQLLWNAIGICTNTAPMSNAGGRTGAVLFVGRAPGPEIAVYLRDVLQRAVQRELTAFKASAFYKRRRNVKTRKAAVSDFLNALIIRLSNRLGELFQKTRSELEQQKALTHLRSRFSTKLVTYQTRDARFSDAAWEGRAAANRVNLSHGVNGARGEARRIGAKP